MESLSDQIIDFTAQMRGLNRTRISLPSRLGQDLGLDGDDAVEFFKQFGERFSVDLRALWDEWDQHFGPEGSPGIIFFLVCALLMGIGEAIHKLIGLLPFWAWGSILIVVWVWPIRCWPARAKKLMPITVQDLVDAAIRKQWYQPESGESYAPRILHN
jgi:hypothetical protein